MRRILVAIGVVGRSGRVLICQRKKENTFGGFWEFPGGKCEEGESLEECLKRELMEEVGIQVEVKRELTPIVHDYAHGQVTLHSFLCGLTEGEPRALECEQTRWVLPGELGNYRFPPANEPLLEEILRVWGENLG